MEEKSDAELLREYTESGAEEAFSAITARYTNLVYTAALRQTTSADAAREITQLVFIALARKGAALSKQLGGERPLISWLYECTRLEVLRFFREDKRRRARERQVMNDQFT